MGDLMDAMGMEWRSWRTKALSEICLRAAVCFAYGTRLFTNMSSWVAATLPLRLRFGVVNVLEEKKQEFDVVYWQHISEYSTLARYATDVKRKSLSFWRVWVVDTYMVLFLGMINPNNGEFAQFTDWENMAFVMTFPPKVCCR